MTRWMTNFFGAMLLAAPLAQGQVLQQTTVQLPTFHFFSIGTSVLVPDRGTAYLGGVDRAEFGSNEFGVPGLNGMPGAGRLFGNRAAGAAVSSSRAQVSATILDMEAMDRAALAGAPGRRESTSTNPAIAKKAAFLTKHIARNGPPAPAKPATGRLK